MAPPAGTLRVGRYFLALLALMAVLYALVFLPGERHTPKLGLDLVGGQQVIFQARAPHGKVPSNSSMQQAKQIMEDRVNGSGVTESTVVIQGADQIVVSIPGATGKDVAKLGAAAKLNFRGVVAAAVPVTCGVNRPKPSATASGSSSTPRSSSPAPSTSSESNAPKDAHNRPLTAPTASARTSAAKTTGSAAKTTGSAAKTTGSAAKTSAAASPSGSGSAPVTGAATCTLKSVAQLKKAVKLPDPSGVYKAGGLSDALASSLAGQLTNFDCSTSQSAPDPAKDYYLACDDGKTYGVKLAYLLGPVIVPGNQISDASAQAPNPSGGSLEWTVQLNLKSSGNDAWANYTGAHNVAGSKTTPGVNQCAQSSTPCADYVGFTLDGQVVSSPVNESAINGQATSISGNFTQSSAGDLAQKLKYGALPFSFAPQQSQTVSATLGTSQLKAGLLAGGIGLALVVIYSLIYYRALGLVTIASLIVSGGLTYAMLVLLGTQIGFVLSLAGIAGFIVAVGITADSFVVFFERIKDEVHEGRSLRVAVPRAWVRARRTILSADTVSFLAAAILYYFAAGDVKGFAFTLGLSTILDLVVVFLFTHPAVSWLSRSRAFGSARFTGLNSVREGGVAQSEDVAAPQRTRPARTGPARTTPARPAADERSAVAVLDEPGDAEPADEDGDGRSAEPPPRRSAGPEPGSAAERAAARRARLRGQSSGNGES